MTSLKCLQQALTPWQHEGILLISSMDCPVNPALALPVTARCQSLQTVAALIPKSKTDRCFQAQLSYAIEQLDIRRIVVLGHNASPIMLDLLTRMIERNLARGPVEEWCRLAEPAVQQAMQEQKSMPELCDDATRQTLLISLKHLMTYEQIASRVDNGQLSLHAWFMDNQHRQLSQWKGECEQFTPFIEHQSSTSAAKAA